MGGLAKITGLEGVINRMLCTWPISSKQSSTITISLFAEFPWNDLPTGTTVCDVGSGVGMVSIELARKYPNLHLTLQDLPHIIEQARTVSKSSFHDQTCSTFLIMKSFIALEERVSCCCYWTPRRFHSFWFLQGTTGQGSGYLLCNFVFLACWGCRNWRRDIQRYDKSFTIGRSTIVSRYWRIYVRPWNPAVASSFVCSRDRLSLFSVYLNHL